MNSFIRVFCPRCEQPTRITLHEDGTRSHECQTCELVAPCQPGTAIPVGPLAHPGQWRERGITQRYVDALWRGQHEAKGGHAKDYRRALYATLSSITGDARFRVHELTQAQCKAVVEYCHPLLEQLALRRATEDERYRILIERAQHSLFPRLRLQLMIIKELARLFLLRSIAQFGRRQALIVTDDDCED